MKTGERLIKHARYHWLFLAEGHLTRASVRPHGGADGGVAGASGERLDQPKKANIRQKEASGVEIREISFRGAGQDYQTNRAIWYYLLRWPKKKAEKRNVRL